MKFRQGRSQDLYRLSFLTQLRIWSMMGVFILRRKTATVSRQNPLGRANSSLSALEAISPGTNVQIRIHVVLEFLGCIRGGGDDFVQLRGQKQAWTGSSDHSLRAYLRSPWQPKEAFEYKKPQAYSSLHRIPMVWSSFCCWDAGKQPGFVSGIMLRSIAFEKFIVYHP